VSVVGYRLSVIAGAATAQLVSTTDLQPPMLLLPYEYQYLHPMASTGGSGGSMDPSDDRRVVCVESRGIL